MVYEASGWRHSVPKDLEIIQTLPNPNWNTTNIPHQIISFWIRRISPVLNKVFENPGPSDYRRHSIWPLLAVHFVMLPPWLPGSCWGQQVMVHVIADNVFFFQTPPFKKENSKNKIPSLRVMRCMAFLGAFLLSEDPRKMNLETRNRIFFHICTKKHYREKTTSQ